MHTHTTQTKQVGVFPCRGLVAPCQRAPRSIKGPPFRCQTREAHKVWPETKAAFWARLGLDGGRTWVRVPLNTPVAVVFENLEDGMTIDEVMQQFPVARDQVKAVLEFAARSLDTPAARR